MTSDAEYADGFNAGNALAAALRVLPTFAGTLGLSPEQAKRPHGAGADSAPAPESIHLAAQDRFLAEGKKLSAEEIAKRKQHGLDIWDMVLEHARDRRFPRGTDVFLFKFLGMFYVAPAQDSFMCRLRLPGGIVSSHQLRGIARLAEEFGGGYADVTTRANLQIRQIRPEHTADVLMGLLDLGIIVRGSGADNIRNITASPTAGIDPQELIDTRPLAREMNHYILNHRELYGLPRKFNIAFDGGGAISALEDTNDIGFAAVRSSEGHEIPAGVYFRLQLGGITGHGDFAGDTGVIVTPAECVPLAAAIVRVFIEHGDRTDRRKARLKYLLDHWGRDRFLTECEKVYGKPLTRFPLDQCEPRPPVQKHGHVGFHQQKQPGKYYAGVVLPVGRMRCNQMRGLADIADRYGSGTIRLTVWQNLLISDIAAEHIAAVRLELRQLGLHYSASSARAGMVACTGNAGCKYAAANTKAHAVEIADYLDAHLKLDQPVNIHLTGCHHSCAQHYIGDIGLLGTRIERDDTTIEGYHLFVGGGFGAEQGIGRKILSDVPAIDAPWVVERILRKYMEHRSDPGESFRAFVMRHSTEELQLLFDPTGAAV